MEDELLKMLESVANEPFNLKHHAAYIRLALGLCYRSEMVEKWLQTRAQMVNAVPAADGKSYVY